MSIVNGVCVLDMLIMMLMMMTMSPKLRASVYAVM